MSRTPASAPRLSRAGAQPLDCAIPGRVRFDGRDVSRRFVGCVRFRAPTGCGFQHRPGVPRVAKRSATVPAHRRTDGSHRGSANLDLPAADAVDDEPSPMVMPADIAEDLARLRHERDQYDRVYNDALTVLDGAIQRLREMPLPPPTYDESQIGTLNERWELLPLKPAESRGWLRRLQSYIWGTVAPVFDRQQAFNAALVDHVNRNA